MLVPLPLSIAMKYQRVPSLLESSQISREVARSPGDTRDGIVVDTSDGQWVPTYRSLIERNLSLTLQQAIQPSVVRIDTLDLAEMRLNAYKIGAAIGAGQFGKVYKALDPDGTVVALKRVSKFRPKYSMNQVMRQIVYWGHFGVATDSMDVDSVTTEINVDRCRWEVYLMQQISAAAKQSGNIHIARFLQCLDAPTSGDLWMVSEWCDLGELQWKRQSRDEVLGQWKRVIGNDATVGKFSEKVVSDLSKGLQFLTDMGCVHRDIKPSNILIDSRHRVLKISDFGCSVFLPSKLPFRYSKNDESRRKVQMAAVNDCFEKELNKIIGTPAFVPPELCRFTAGNEVGSEPAMLVKDGFQLDIWSFGVTLYCILQNELPFSGNNEFDTYHLINSKSLLAKANGNWLNDMVINSMLDKNPDTRMTIKEVGKVVKTNVKESASMKGSSGAKNSFKKFWRKLSKSKSKEDVTDVEPPKQDDFRISRITTNTSLSSSLNGSDVPINITDFIDSLTNEKTKAEEHPSQDTEEPIYRSTSNASAKSSENTPSLNIPTPIKNMIKIKASPEKTASTTTQDANSTQPKKMGHMRPSKNIMNFKNYMDKDAKSVDTIDQIKDYLRYDGDFT